MKQGMKHYGHRAGRIILLVCFLLGVTMETAGHVTLLYGKLLSVYDDDGELCISDMEDLDVTPSAQDHYDNTLYIKDVEAQMNAEITLSVKMKNSVYAEGFAFDLILPVGMEVVTDDDGNPAASLSEERTTTKRTDTFGAAMLTAYPSSAVRVIAVSSNGSAISPGDGEVCTVRVRIPAGMSEGQYQLQLRKISISDIEARSHDVEEMISTINVLEYLLGDANSDGQVTVADLMAIAQYVLGHTPEGFSFRGADINMDNKVNVADYIGVAHILGEDPTQSQGGFGRRPPIKDLKH